MTGIIYYIINIQNNKRYVGKTFDLKRRLSQHFSLLRKNKHHSHKLQNAFNKYGEDSFIVDFFVKEISNEDELKFLEMEEIEKFDSYNNGYNETLGGEGNRILFNLKTSILLYNILQNYDGVARQIARYYNCDHSCILEIKNNALYKNCEYDSEEYNQLIKKINLSEKNLKENYIKHNERKLDEQKCIELLSVITQKTGYDKTMCEIFDINSKTLYRLKKGLIYLDYLDIYNKKSEEEKKKILEETFKKYNVENIRLRRSRKNKGINNPLTQEQVNFILDNEKMSSAEIGRQLNISADRVRGVKNRKTYKDLIINYDKNRHV